MKIKEARIAVSDLVLSEGQSMAVRVACNSFLMELQEPEFREGIGETLAAAYEARLREVCLLLIRSAESRP